MRFEKGNTSGKGRPPGRLNKATVLHRNVISEFLTGEATVDKLKTLYGQLKPRDQAQFVVKLFSFVTPKLEAHELTTEGITREQAREIINALIDEKENESD